VLQIMFWKKVKTISVLLIAFSLGGIGTGLSIKALSSPLTTPSNQQNGKKKPPPIAKNPKKENPESNPDVTGVVQFPNSLNAFFKQLRKANTDPWKIKNWNELGIPLSQTQFKKISRKWKGLHYSEIKGFGIILSNWLDHNPIEVKAWCTKLVTLFNKSPGMSLGSMKIFQRIYKEWISKDIKAPGQWSIGLPAGRGRQVAVNMLVIELLNQDLDQAIRFAKKLSPRDLGMPAHLCSSMSKLGRAWAQKDPKSAATWAITLPKNFRLYSGSGALYSITEVWAKTDPEAALQFALSIPQEKTKKKFIFDTVRCGLESVKKGRIVLALLNSIPKGEKRDGFIRIFSIRSLNWKKQDKRSLEGDFFPKLYYLISDSSNKNSMEWAVLEFSKAWAALGIERIIEWTKTLPIGKKREIVLAGTAAEMAKTQFEKAYKFIKNLPEGFGRDQGLTLIVQNQALKIPEKIMLWLDSLPEGHSRNKALKTFINSHLNNLKSNLSYAKLVEICMNMNPLDEILLVKILNSWLLEDPLEARKWIRGSGLDEVKKNELLGEKETNEIF